MKTAICFNGLVGSTGGKSSDLQGDPKKCFEISSELYKENILEQNDVDIFVHSWSTNMKDKILETYKPKKHLIEEQIIFDVPEHVKGEYNRKQGHYSRWYSAKKCLELKSEYENKNNFKYDCVMLARFDLAWQTNLIFEYHDQNYFWTGRWPKKVHNDRILPDKEYWKLSRSPYVYNNEVKQWVYIDLKTRWWGYPHNRDGLLGTWFFSNSETMDKFGELYDNLNTYTEDGNCPNDRSDRISNHQLSLYHLKQIGLLDKLKFCEKNWHDDNPTVSRKYF